MIESYGHLMNKKQILIGLTRQLIDPGPSTPSSVTKCS